MNWWETVDWQDPINRDCPLNAGIVGWWMGAPGLFGGNRLWDLTNRNHGVLTNMDPATDWVNSQYGPLVDTDGSNDYIDCGTGAFPATPECSLLIHTPRMSTSGLFTAIGGYSTGGFDQDRLVLGKANSGDFRWILRDSASSQRIISYGNASTIRAGGDNLWGITVKSGEARIFQNGLFSTNSTALTGGLLTTGTIQCQFGRTPGRNESYLSMGLQCVISISRGIGDEQHAYVYDQFRRGFPDMLNHYRRRSIFLPQVASFNPAWALRQSRIIGGGVI